MTVAGDSARRVARSKRDRAAALIRQAENFERGAAGEEVVGGRLALLPTPDWQVLHDVHWPGRLRANLDHVVVGPTGVYVIDAKSWSGVVSVRHGVLRQNGRSRETAQHGVAEAALAVAAAVPGLDPYLVRPVLCFVDQSPGPGWARDVMLTTPDNVVEMMWSRGVVFTPAQVSELAVAIRSATLSSESSTCPKPPGYVQAATAYPLQTPKRSRRLPRSGRSPVGAVVLGLLIVLLLLGGGPLAGRLLASAGQALGRHVASGLVHEHPFGTAVRVDSAGHPGALRIGAAMPSLASRRGSPTVTWEVRLHVTNAGPPVRLPMSAVLVTGVSGVDAVHVERLGPTPIHWLVVHGHERRSVVLAFRVTSGERPNGLDLGLPGQTIRWRR